MIAAAGTSFSNLFKFFFKLFCVFPLSCTLSVDLPLALTFLISGLARTKYSFCSNAQWTTSYSSLSVFSTDEAELLRSDMRISVYSITYQRSLELGFDERTFSDSRNGSILLRPAADALFYSFPFFSWRGPFRRLDLIFG
jgi:hypothetical protein